MGVALLGDGGHTVPTGLQASRRPRLAVRACGLPVSLGLPLSVTGCRVSFSCDAFGFSVRVTPASE